MGRVYRSGQIDQLGDLDRRTLAADHVRLVCDLRTDEERARGPDRLPSGAEPLVADVLGGSEVVATTRDVFADSGKERAVMANGAGRRFMIAVYRQLVSSPAARGAYHALFTRLADPAALPGVFHCSGGKDRTGWAAAVLLTMLGVPRPAVVEDFLLSNTYLRARTAARLSHLGPGVDPTLLEPLLVVDPGYLNAAFDEVQQRYGSFDRYLHEGLGLDDAALAALRAELLTD
jgi:protein-tyrosine phosphatase